MVRIIISIVMVPMLVPVPAIFIRVMVVPMTLVAVVERPVFLVSWFNVNAEPIVCF